MLGRGDRRRWRLILAWALCAALLGSYGLLGEEERPDEAAQGSGPGLPEDGDSKDKLEITEIRPVDPTPGSAVEVQFVNTFVPAADRPLRAWISVTDYARGRQLPPTELAILHASEDRLIVRIPREAFPGRAKVRVGYDKDERSKPYDLRLRAVNHRKLFREVVGGLAILLFGLRVMSRGSRQYTSHRSQGVLGRIGRRTPAAVGLGVVVGGLTQFTTTAAGLVVGLVGSHLLTVVPAVAVLLGAQLGAAVTPSVLGLASTREGLLVVAIGVLWLGLAADRRSEAFGKIVLGCGLLFFGLHILRQGFEPLVADPEVFPYLERLDASTALGRLWCVAAGALLTAVLQGPAPVFVLVLGLAQSTGQLDLPSALAVLAGTGLGGAVGTVVVAWPFGLTSRRVARLHMVLALLGTVLLALTVNGWAALADALVPGAAAEVTYGKKVLLPRLAGHLVAGFALSQVFATALLAAALPGVERLLQRLPRRMNRQTAKPVADAIGLRGGLVHVLERHRLALEAIHQLCLTAERERGRECEHLLADARNELRGLLGGAVRSRNKDSELDGLRQATLAVAQLQRALEELLRQAERSTEQSMAIAPVGDAWQLPPHDEANLKALHGLLLEGLNALAPALARGLAPDLDAARAREIRLNALESESRQGLLVDGDRGAGGERQSGLIALRLNSSELVNAYEAVGNHLYRLAETLAAEVEQEDLP